MALLTDLIGFGEPGGDFVVDLVHALEPKSVKMVSRRKSLDSAKARILEPTREDYMSVHPVSSNDEGGKAHPNLKRDPGFLGQNGYRAVAPGEGEQLVENGADRFRFVVEMRSEVVIPAGVGLIAIGESAAALRTTPEGWAPFRCHHAFSCLINPAISTRPHASAARPSSIRQTLNPSIRTFFPVGSIPKKAPRCTPSETQ